MASAAAIAGVAVNGLSWKYSIDLQKDVMALVKLRGQIGTPADAPRLIAAYDRIVATVKKAHAGWANQPLHEPLGRFIDLELDSHIVEDIDIQFGGDPDAMIDAICAALDDLYDIFDYHRVVVR